MIFSHKTYVPWKLRDNVFWKAPLTHHQFHLKQKRIFTKSGREFAFFIRVGARSFSYEVAAYDMMFKAFYFPSNVFQMWFVAKKTEHHELSWHNAPGIEKLNLDRIYLLCGDLISGAITFLLPDDLASHWMVLLPIVFWLGYNLQVERSCMYWFKRCIFFLEYLVHSPKAALTHSLGIQKLLRCTYFLYELLDHYHISKESVPCRNILSFPEGIFVTNPDTLA